ncbi:PTS transporter subunit EIIC [Staphylococcus aureus]
MQPLHMRISKRTSSCFKLEEHADKIITSGTMFIVTFGGTGATLVVPFRFTWMTKSKRNKAIGRASVVHQHSSCNEPIYLVHH